jgi:hypothetical protein
VVVPVAWVVPALRCVLRARVGGFGCGPVPRRSTDGGLHGAIGRTGCYRSGRRPTVPLGGAPVPSGGTPGSFDRLAYRATGRSRWIGAMDPVARRGTAGGKSCGATITCRSEHPGGRSHGIHRRQAPRKTLPCSSDPQSVASLPSGSGRSCDANHPHLCTREPRSPTTPEPPAPDVAPEMVRHARWTCSTARGSAPWLLPPVLRGFGRR